MCAAREYGNPYVKFVCAGLAFFGISTHMAGHQNRAFERHFQEISKVRADRRKLKEENEALRAENTRLRGRLSYSPPPQPSAAPAEEGDTSRASSSSSSPSGVAASVETEQTYTFQG